MFKKLYRQDGFKKVIPSFIKLEILKEEYLKVYKIEVNFEEKNVEYNRVDKFDYTKIDENFTVKHLYFNLSEGYQTINDLIIDFELSEEEKLKLYRWCKEARRELKLKDNLFNICELFIGNNKYERINDEVNNQKVL